MPKVEFEGQFPDEKLSFVFRRHVISMRKGLYGLMVSFVLGSIPFLLWQDNVNLLWGSLIGLVVGLIFLFYHWIGWHFSVYIVTNQRIRQTSQKGLFGRSVIDLNLEKVQNISYNIPGFTGEIFGFGTIVLQTMVGNMVINKVAHCEQVYNRLSDAVHRAGGGQGSKDNEEESVDER